MEGSVSWYFARDSGLPFFYDLVGDTSSSSKGKKTYGLFKHVISFENYLSELTKTTLLCIAYS